MAESVAVCCLRGRIVLAERTSSYMGFGSNRTGRGKFEGGHVPASCNVPLNECIISISMLHLILYTCNLSLRVSDR